MNHGSTFIADKEVAVSTRGSQIKNPIYKHPESGDSQD